jgi:hypothetical protein
MTKKEMYWANLYSFPPPSVHTNRWDEDDWIRYIDQKGIWHGRIRDNTGECNTNDS